MTPRDISHRLGLSLRRVRELINAGSIAATSHETPHGVKYYDVSEKSLQAYLASPRASRGRPRKIDP